MSVVALACTRCNAPLESERFESAIFTPCLACGAELQVQLFPAFWRLAEGPQNTPAAVMAGEASCYFHAEKQAVVACGKCGRFLCALCDLDLGGEHCCPQCLQSARQRETLALVRSRTSWSSLAVLLATLPLLVWPLTIVTAPIALFVAFWGWSKPPSITGRKKRLQFVFAIVFSLLQIAGWIALGVVAYNAFIRA